MLRVQNTAHTFEIIATTKHIYMLQETHTKKNNIHITEYGKEISLSGIVSQCTYNVELFIDYQNAPLTYLSSS